MSIWSEKIAGVRIASEFATSGNGTYGDRYMIDFNDIIADAPDNLVHIFVDGTFKMTDTCIVDDKGFILFGMGQQSNPWSNAHKENCIYGPDNKVAFKIGENMWYPTGVVNLMHISNIRFDGRELGQNAFFEMYKGASEPQFHNLEFAKCWKALKFIAGNYIGIHNCWFIGERVENGGVLIEIAPSEQTINNLWIYNSWIHPRGRDNLQKGLLVADGQLDEIQLYNIRYYGHANHIVHFEGIPPKGIIHGGIVVQLDTKDVFHFDDLDDPHNAHLSIKDIDVIGGSPDRFIYIGTNHDYIDIMNNKLSGQTFGIEPITIAAGANIHGEIAHNTGV